MIVKLEGREEVIELAKLRNSEILNMIDIALEFENYEMCANLERFKK